ncbi:MAG: Nif3-like dinuclear metal center hexameric protein, partial [Clostridia bacterium]|nr:Nif3-like dinuclear metal center hexameric protein [Clostridia bacterium]
MTVRELSKLLDARFPRALSCEWDNDGLQVSPDPDAPVTGVLLALDPCDEAIAEAEKTGCNVILTHHPLIFDPLSEIVADSGQGRRIRRLLSAGISS